MEPTAVHGGSLFFHVCYYIKQYFSLILLSQLNPWNKDVFFLTPAVCILYNDLMMKTARE